MHPTSYAVMLTASTTLLARSALADIQRNSTRYVGCYSSAGSMSQGDTFMYQSRGHCQEICIPDSSQEPQAVMGLNKGSDCWCGSALPPESDKLDDDECDDKCDGYDKESCGGTNTYSVYLTGYNDDVAAVAPSDRGPDDGPDSPSSNSNDSDPPPPPPPPPSSSPSPSAEADSTTASQPVSVITKAGQTIIITAAGQADATSQPSSEVGGSGEGGGSSKVGIAVGVVVGVVVLCALVGAGVFFIRHRKRKAVEEEYRRNQTANNFIATDKPGSNGGSISDQRLDPSILHHRRQSDGSIADEKDFSRRILQVRNPDGA